MNIKNTIIKHYKNFFDLHAKGIALDEDDHLNIDWADDLVKNCFIADVSHRRELFLVFAEFKDQWEHDNNNMDSNEVIVNEFLKTNNCG